VVASLALDAEVRLRQAEAVLTAAFDAAPVAIGVFSVDDADFGRLLRSNDAGARFFGRSHEELAGLRFQDLLPPEEAVANEAAVRRMAALGTTPPVVVKRYVASDGSDIYGRVHLSFALDDHGRSLFGIAQIEDHTENHRREEALRVSEHRLGDVFAKAPIAMTMVDCRPGCEGIFLEVNRAFAQLVGRPVDELVGMHIADVVHPDDLDLPGANLSDQIAENLDVISAIKRYVRPDGSVRIGSMTGAPVRDAAGVISYSIGTIADITDMVRAENARQLIVDGAFDGIVSIDGLGRIIEFNAAAERIFGHCAEEVLARPMDAVLIPEEGRARHRAGVAAVRRGEIDETALEGLTVTALHADGRRIPIEITIRRSTPDGEDFTAIVRDLTREVRAERRQQGAEGLFRSLFESSAVGMVVQNLSGEVVEANQEFSRFVGRPAKELLGRVANDVTHPDDRVDHVDVLALLEERESIRREKRFVRLDGEVVWGLVHATLLRDDRGRPRGIQSQIVDINEQHQATARLATVLNSIGEGVFVHDADGIVEAINPAAEQLLGYTSDQVVGKPMHATVHAHTGPASTCPILLVATTGEAIRVEDDSFRCADGSLLPVAYSAAPLERGDRRGVVVVFSDITERKARELSMQRRLDVLDGLEAIRAAMREDRLVLYSQPILELAGGEVAQEEILLRMVGTDGTVIAPGEFLPLAEEHGLIAEIDRWVIGQAAQVAATGRHVEVNVSGVTLEDPELTNWVEAALQVSGADPRLLTFEITETALTDDLEQASRFAERVAELGCGFALDDFGTGYGSFTLIKRLPISYLKIDMEFVRALVHNEADRHVVTAIVNLARGLGQRTIAEGVEDEATLEILREIGVDFVQGYLIGRPAPIEAAGS
jgi:PAS domain S-box-containing protein